jgi:ammonia channel protein AmtB
VSGSVVVQNAFTVLSMQAGFALLEAGSVSELSVVNIMVSCNTLECCRVLYRVLGLRIGCGRSKIWQRWELAVHCISSLDMR